MKIALFNGAMGPYSILSLERRFIGGRAWTSDDAPTWCTLVEDQPVASESLHWDFFCDRKVG